MAENHFMAEMYINLGSLYGRLTLWRDGFSQNQQNEQLYGEEHFMAERWSALWQRCTNFMDKILKGGVFYPNPTVYVPWQNAKLSVAGGFLLHTTERAVRNIDTL